MPTNFPIPAAERIREVLTDLMGRPVKVVRTEAADLDGARPGACADYAAGRGTIGVLCVADLRLTNTLGAALTMVAPAVVEDAVAKREIDESTIDNFREVLNVLTSLFNTADTAHVTFRDVHRMPAQLPSDTAQLLHAPKARRDFEVEVEEYGAGVLTVLVA
ncbi:MAG: CheY-like receiver [Actinomycetia bacterium]|nr:CheY-like receiver [Actinomycetes bacterium]